MDELTNVELSTGKLDNSIVIEWNISKNRLESNNSCFIKTVSVNSKNIKFQDITGVNIEEYVHKDDKARYIDLLNIDFLTDEFDRGISTHELDYRSMYHGRSYRWKNVSVQLIKRNNDVKAYIIHKDIHEKKCKELEMIGMAENDPLTGVYNRGAFIEHAKSVISDNSKNSHAFIMIDVDCFKEVNDTFGHTEGDRVLKEIAKKIKSLLRQDDIVGRIGGDKFIVCIKNIPNKSLVEKKAQQICNKIRERLCSDIILSVSAGISLYPKDGNTFDELYRNADTALYYVKDNGRDGFAFYKDDNSCEEKKNDSTDNTSKNESLPKARMLVVDDSPMDREIYEEIYKEEYIVLKAANGNSALSLMNKYGSNISIVLLDLNMPVMDGFEILKRMRENKSTANLPVVVISSDSDPEVSVRAINEGADDYIEKPINTEIMRLRVTSAISRRDNIRLKKENLKLVNRTEHDILTGLYSRQTFIEKAKEMIQARKPGHFIISNIDIDNFRLINEHYGYEQGDKLLLYLSKIISKSIDEEDSIACRLYADRFVLLYPYNADNYDIIDKIYNKFCSYKDVFGLNICTGSYVINDINEQVRSIIDKASIARASIKNNPTKHMEFFNEKMQDNMLLEQEVISEMYEALEKKEFIIYLQPQFNNETGEVLGAEALVRWRHSTKGIIQPVNFIHVFEKNGFIKKLDKYIFEEVCKLLNKWEKSSLDLIPISVNVSRLDLLEDDFCKTLTSITKQYNIPNRMLRLEINESAFLHDKEKIIDVITRLRKSGFLISIDDFGSNTSSINLLKDVPADVLKINSKFFENDTFGERDNAILNSVINIANWLNMNVIAEGVETKEQADYLKKAGCVNMQGYLYAKSMSVNDMEKSSYLSVRL